MVFQDLKIVAMDKGKGNVKHISGPRQSIKGLHTGISRQPIGMHRLYAMRLPGMDSPDDLQYGIPRRQPVQ
ncbi:MAG TPA: hypothetical protein PLP19_10375 [bacterium]|nr:hypothetical protein [bacterium]HPN43884.1 hypothetical protein [bacterium]